MTRVGSVLSRFRMAGIMVIVGISLAGGLFYGLVHSHFLGRGVERSRGPYSDALSAHGFAAEDPTVWQDMAGRHEVAIIVHPPEGEPFAYDHSGQRMTVPESEPSVLSHIVQARRTGPDGTRVTFQYSLFSFTESHVPILTGMLVLIVALVGSTFWFLHRLIRPLTLLHRGVDAVAKGDFMSRVPVIRDDEIGEVARSFNDMTARVGGMIEDRERLLSDVSHELRSPIARMKVALELLPCGDKRDVLDRDLREMESLIAVLLEREALRSRAERLEGEEVDLVAVAAGVVEVNAARCPGVELSAIGPSVVNADPALIKMVIQNLVDNAIKFSCPDSAPVRVTVQADGGQTVLRVTDDGIGIGEGSDEQLFKPFVKGDWSRGHGEGFGFGLNLCQRIVGMHGGTIRLLPREPRGTEAVVVL